jgi:Aromatic amino acid lyase
MLATDPSLNFFGKGIDIAQAAYVAELAYLATPVSTGVQSAEMHNQAVKYVIINCSIQYTIILIYLIQLSCTYFRTLHSSITGRLADAYGELLVPPLPSCGPPRSSALLRT